MINIKLIKALQPICNNSHSILYNNDIHILQPLVEFIQEVLISHSIDGNEPLTKEEKIELLNKLVCAAIDLSKNETLLRFSDNGKIISVIPSIVRDLYFQTSFDNANPNTMNSIATNLKLLFENHRRLTHSLALASSFSPENIREALAQEKPVEYGYTLYVLKQAGLLTLENKNLIKNNPNAAQIYRVLSYLSNLEEVNLTQAQLEAVINCPSPNALANIWIFLNEKCPQEIGLLYRYYRDFIDQAHLFGTPEVSDALFNISPIVIKNLDKYNLLGEFISGLFESFSIKKGEQTVESILSDIATSIRCNENAGEPDDKEKAKDETRKETHESDYEENVVEENKNRKETNLTSVHPNASQSAIKLWNRYHECMKSQLHLSVILAEVLSWAETIPKDSLRSKAAYRAVKRLLFSKYKDPVSNITLSQLIALVWLTIHDEATRKVPLDEALEQLLEGFYETQRCFNINTSYEGEENGLRDKPVNLPKCFSSILDELQGVDDDIIVSYKTIKLAKSRTKTIVREEVIKYLKHCAKNMTADEVPSFLDLIDELKYDADIIWEEIGENVENRLFHEFASVFKNKEDAYWEWLLDDMTTEISQLPTFEKELAIAQSKPADKGKRKAAESTVILDKFFGVFKRARASDNNESDLGQQPGPSSRH